MKKLSITLLMLLCLIASMLAFASCGDPEPEECSHVWAAEATVDKAASCTEAGTKSVKCTVCGEKKEGSVETVPAAHAWGAIATEDTASTCTVAGSKSIKCTACGEKKADSIEALPLAEHPWNAEATVDSESTCNEAGSKSVKCSVCGTKQEGTEEALPLAEHNWDTIPTIDVEPSCEVEGSKSVKCLDCFTAKPGSVQTIEKLEHDWADVATEDKAPTCTEDGVKTVKCKECPAKKPGSEEAIPASHTWGVTYSVDTEPSCTEDGVKSLKCTVCGEKKPGSEVPVPATHIVDGGTVLVWPTLFTKGERYGLCVACGADDVIAYIDETKPDIRVIDSSYAGTFVQKWNFGSDILKNGQNHFYPTEDDPDGKSLFVEFAFLWNETLKNNIYEQSVGFVRLANSGGGESNGMWWLNFADDIEDKACQFAGGFEPSAGTVISGPNCMVDGGAKEDYPNLGEYGWHRIGIQVRQTAEIVNGAVEYKMYSTLYIDGVKVCEYQLDENNINEKNYLYTAEIVDGELQYSDIGKERYLYVYRIGEGGTRGNNKAYFCMGDLSVRCADELGQKVEPVEEPEEAFLEVEQGVYIPASVYYKLSESLTEECVDHKDKNDDGVCDIPNCGKSFYDGCDLIDCLDTDKDFICDNANCNKETTNRPIPTVCEHEYLVYDVTVVATMFSPGYKTAHCPVCDEYFYQDINTLTSHSVVRMSASGSGTYVIKRNIKDDVLKGAHFYPTEDNPEGNDLFMEFSFLWNETLANSAEGYMAIGAPSNKDGGNAVRPFQLAFVDNHPDQWCKQAGGFESCDGAVIISGAECNKENGTYPNLGEYGWHRIGVQIHQEADIVDDAVKYTVLASLYIDGVMVCCIDISNHENMEANLLYTARIIAGKLVYTDNPDATRTALAYRLASRATVQDEMYFVDGDAYITAGKNFVIPVEPVANPKSATLTVADGVNLPAAVYYKVSGVDDFCRTHVDADDNGICDNTDCDAAFYDGCDLVDCLDTDKDGICNNANCSKETSNRPIPTVCDHDSLEYETTTVATMFAPGEKTAYCVVCGEYFYEEIDQRTSYDVTKTNTSSSGTHIVKRNMKNDVLKGDHFYPTEENPEGNDLFMEFSFLWNETLAKNTDGYMGIGAPSASNGGNAVRPFYLNFADGIDGQWCQEAGGFESVNGAVYVSGADCTKANGVYPNLGEYGWHRIGVQIHQEAAIVDGAVKYTVIASLYIDGAKVSVIDISGADNMEANLLYTAKIVDGKLVYSDNADTGRTAVAYRINDKKTTSGEMYFVDGDIYVTAGKDFVVPVEPVEDPKSATLSVASGVELPASVYYKVSGIDIVCKNHVDGNDDGECDNDGCEEIYFDGCDTISCYDSDGDGFCDNDGCTKETENGPAPTVCDHVNLPYEVSKVPTMFAVGERAAHCPVCGETFTETYGSLTSADVRKFTSSDSGTYVTKENIRDSVLDGAHFYPTEDNPDGNDLFFEFSFLWNETLANNKDGYMGVGAPSDKNGGNAVRPFYLNFADGIDGQWCQEAGGFETCGKAVLVEGADCTKENGVYPNLGEYGWHRIGVQIHQEAAIVDGAVKYTVIASLYIDGAKVSVIDISGADNMEANLLYTAKIVNGKLVYSDNSDTGRTAFAYRLANKGTTGEDMFFADGDSYITAGKSFVVEVEPVANPEAQTLTVADGVDLPANVYYKVK